MKKSEKVTVLGAGIWGSVLANHIAKKGHIVKLWEYSPELFRKIEKTGRHPSIEKFKFRKNINFTPSLSEAVSGADLILIALHSDGIRTVIRKIKRYIASSAVIVNASKGIEYKSSLTMSEVIEEELKPAKNKVLALSGPSFAKEVAKNIPTKLTLAGKNIRGLNKIKSYFNHYPITIELSTDRKTVEFGGSLKNVFAIACGIINKKFGANTKAVLVSQSLAEMNLIIKSVGGKTETLYGISGLGDFILTGTSSMSRNTLLGEKLAKGLDFEKAKKQIKTVTEGVAAVKAVFKIVKIKRINAPIASAVYNIVCKRGAPENLLKSMGFENDGK